MSVWEALATLDGFVDLSDPDTSLPNSVHAFQARRYLYLAPCMHTGTYMHAHTHTPPHIHAPDYDTHVTWLSPPQCAEGLRAACMPDWLQLTGLIHDLGKMVPPNIT